MAEYNFEENVEEISIRTENLPERYFTVEQTDVITGGPERNHFLYYQLKMSMMRAEGIDIIVSFLMESGVRMILKDLKDALGRGVKIRILTGNYLGITQPSALYMIKKDLGEAVDLRFYNDSKRSFHPKAYIFHGKEKSEIYIGSSNVSRSALTSGIEWNYRFDSLADGKNFRLFSLQFEELFFSHSIQIDDEELRKYSKNWHKPAIARDLKKYDDEEHKKISIPLFQPRGVQIEALYALENSRKEGAVKGLVQAATGVGKTYLAAFDSMEYQKVLFVAHREEILKQAAISFGNVRNNDDMGFFYGKQKDKDKSVIFASVATLGREEYLQEKYFPRDYFDYLIIDEFHHAINEQYKRIVNYFKPKFMLGLTATPDRMDGRDIYEICDYNVPYEISLFEAINKGILVPFHYYGIFDETDYSGLHLVNGVYRENDLTEIYKDNAKRYELIYKYYQKYRSKRALGFCCSKQHAEKMAEEFCKRGVLSVSVYSGNEGEYAENRSEAIEKLIQQKIRVIFCVDMFNEGLDIASLDMVMFLRPTESPVVFLQQLGRGLRTDRGKDYLTVLDFIGNYEKAGKTPFLLSRDISGQRERLERDISYTELEYPDDCIVDFDMRLIDLFQEMKKKSLSAKERIHQEYFRVKELLNNRTPSRMELFTYMDDEIYGYCVKHAKENPFRHYLDFLFELGELSDNEKVLYQGIGREFLAILETTDMQKVYKMPILYSFYNHGDIRLQVTEEDVLESWKQFFDTGTNWKDFSADISYEEYRAMSDKKHLNKAKTMPVKFLKASGKGFFIDKEGFVIALREELKDIIGNKALKEHMGDILEYRTMEYYRRRYEKTI